MFRASSMLCTWGKYGTGHGDYLIWVPHDIAHWIKMQNKRGLLSVHSTWQCLTSSRDTFLCFKADDARQNQLNFEVLKVNFEFQMCFWNGHAVFDSCSGAVLLLQSLWVAKAVRKWQSCNEQQLMLCQVANPVCNICQLLKWTESPWNNSWNCDKYMKWAIYMFSLLRMAFTNSLRN